MAIQNFEETINRLKPYLPEYLTEILGIDPSSTFSCPFPDHNDETPSASIVGLQTESPRVHCFSCGRTLDIFDACCLLEKKPAVGQGWIDETLKYLADKYSVDVQMTELTPEQIYKLDTYRAYRVAADLLQPIMEGEFKRASLERKWDTTVMSENGVGTIRHYSDFRKALRQTGFTVKFLDEIDLGRRDIFSPDNMVFTWRDEKGRPIGFTSRNLKYEQEKEEARKSGKKSNARKYNNQKTTGLKCNIFRKGSRLYGIDVALKATPPLYIFEGQADVITARQHGLLNCVAIAGSAISEDHIHLLKRLSITEVILCLDADPTGKEKLPITLSKFAGHRDIDLKVLELPEGEDPDSFIRSSGIAAFKTLPVYSAFEYRLNQFSEDDLPEDICSQMIPFIVNEPSAVKRDSLCKHLSKTTGVALRAITEDLYAIINQKARERSEVRRGVIERCTWELNKNPQDAEQILLQAKTELQNFDRQHNDDTLSSESFIQSINLQKKEEEESTRQAGLSLGPEFSELREWLRGEWRGTFWLVGGKEHTGKTAILCKLAYQIATNNENVTVIYHSIDDSFVQMFPRFVCVAYGDRRLTINQVKDPKYWDPRVENLTLRREVGYQKVLDLAYNNKLIVKDGNSGSSLSYSENLIQYHQEKNPDSQIVYILDNFHKSTDFPGKEERIRNKQLSCAMKDMSTRLQVPVICSVEYTKLAPGIKPTKHNILETGQLAYDANICMHLYSELTDTPNNFSVYHTGLDWRGEKVILPRVEVLVDKNKISGKKGFLYFDFWPESSDYIPVDRKTVSTESELAKSSFPEDDGFGKKE